MFAYLISAMNEPTLARYDARYRAQVPTVDAQILEMIERHRLRFVHKMPASRN
jgi:hypothetical protein